MEKVKIDSAKVLFWDSLELKVKILDKEFGWNGWKAILMQEFMLSGAAMTMKGARDLVLAGGKAEIDPKEVGRFIDETCKVGLLKVNYEIGIKTKKRRRVYRSMFRLGQFKFQKITLKEEE